jgi:hypothetical protein
MPVKNPALPTQPNEIQSQHNKKQQKCDVKLSNVQLIKAEENLSRTVLSVAQKNPHDLHAD